MDLTKLKKEISAFVQENVGKKVANGKEFKDVPAIEEMDDDAKKEMVSSLVDALCEKFPEVKEMNETSPIEIELSPETTIDTLATSVMALLEESSSEEEEEEEEGEEEENEETEEEEEPKMKNEDVKNEIDRLFAQDQTLSEEFKEKAAFLFETVLTQKIEKEAEQIREELESSFQEKLQEAIESHSEVLNEELETLTGKIDEYITYVAEEWMSENEIAVEKGIRTEITEQFIFGLKNLFTENYIEVPEGKENLVVSLEEKNEELVDQINVHLKRNMNLKKQLQEEKRKNILSEQSFDLNLAEREQLKSLAESVDFENEKEFEKKIKILKEHYFNESETLSETSVDDLTEDEQYESSTLLENYHEPQSVSAIDLYKQAISKYKF